MPRPSSLLALSLAVGSWLFAQPLAGATPVLDAVDARTWIEPGDFQPTGEAGVWRTGRIDAGLPYDEMIYSWMTRLGEGEGFRLYVQTGFPNGDESPWLYAGHWGDVEINTDLEREWPRFEHGKNAIDHVILEKSASWFRFEVRDEGTSPLGELPRLHVVVTQTEPSEELRSSHGAPRYGLTKVPVMDLPLRKQEDSKGNATPDRCQTAAVATAMEYYGKALPLEDLLPWTYDAEYRHPGVWPRTIGVAAQKGFTVYIDRFRTWDQVKAAVQENKVILCSISMTGKGPFVAPPYPKMGGHIVALNGVTDDGRVITTDSALGENGRGYLCQWLVEDFEKVWLERGGIGMVVVPPSGTEPRHLGQIPPFPEDQYANATPDTDGPAS